MLEIRAIQFAIDVVGNLVKGFNNLQLVLPFIRLGFAEVATSVLQFGNALISGVLDVVGDVAEGLSDFLEFLEATANRIPGINISLAGVAASFDNLSASTEQSRRNLAAQNEILEGAAELAGQEVSEAYARVAAANERVDATVNGVNGRLDELVFRFQAG